MAVHSFSKPLPCTSLCPSRLCAAPGPGHVGVGCPFPGHLLLSHLREASEKLSWVSGSTLPSSFRLVHQAGSFTPHFPHAARAVACPPPLPGPELPGAGAEEEDAGPERLVSARGGGREARCPRRWGGGVAPPSSEAARPRSSHPAARPPGRLTFPGLE